MSTQLDKELSAPMQAPLDDEFPLPSNSRRIVRRLVWMGVFALLAAAAGFFMYRRSHALPLGAL